VAVRGLRLLRNRCPRAAITSSEFSGESLNTTATTSGKPDVSAGPASLAWRFHFRAAGGYDAAVRVLGGAWFLLFALAAALKAIENAQCVYIVGFNPAAWAAVLSSTCLVLFYLVLYWAMLVRPPPTARFSGLPSSIIAFAGTYLPWTIVLFGPTEASTSQNIASAVFLVVGATSMVFVILYLGRSFSIVPQARKLVRSGPYAVVRNPLYLVEEIAVLGILLQCLSPLAFVLVVAHGVLQVRRILYEEDLLRRTFPDYDDYASSTSRLIPYVW
jgi:protein-S-isoprenylcysteine O-methyltransferase Ste14